MSNANKVKFFIVATQIFQGRPKILIKLSKYLMRGNKFRHGSFGLFLLQYFFVVNLYQRCIGIFDRSYSLLLRIHTQTVTTYMKCQNYRRNWYKLTTKNYWRNYSIITSLLSLYLECAH